MHPELLVVGIALSAGGITPLLQLIEEAICHKNMSFILTPHLSRDHESLLPDILRNVSALKIKTIEDNMKLEPCHIYVIPPKSYVVVKNHRLRLEPRPDKGTNQAADVLFSSLAKFYKDNAIAVVLSGSAVGADGSKGIQEIKKYDGHTYAQKPETAEFPQMPALAIETGCVDSVLTPQEIGQELSMVSWSSSV